MSLSQPSRTVYGLTGKLCAGKDQVAACFHEAGWLVIDEDKIGHEALVACSTEILNEFGERVTDEVGAISRSRLGSVVFNAEADLRRLEAIVHPWMVAETRRRLDSRTEACAVVNAAILFKMGLHELCDRVIIVRAPTLLRLIRCVRRDHRGIRSVLWRMSAQRSLNRVPEGVDTVTVWNIGALRSLRRRVSRLVPE